MFSELVAFVPTKLLKEEDKGNPFLGETSLGK